MLNFVVSQFHELARAISSLSGFKLDIAVLQNGSQNRKKSETYLLMRGVNFILYI